ncbi:hypothetical protein [Amycolatopsis magusensis]|uniref:hypothetical protein n=1 Tax=Amycolatopsis magusensis TaxID=882444 RepID=UPI003C30691E
MATGQRTIKIRFDGSAAGFSKAAAVVAAQVRAVEQRTEKMKAGFAAVPARVGAAAASLFSAASALATFGGGVGVVLAVVSAIGAVSGAAGLAVPALFGLVGVMAAIKLGGDGIKRAFEGLKPTMDTLKSQVSASFEKSLAPAVNNLKAVLPQLRVGLQATATAMGGVATKFTAMLKNTGAASQLNGIFIQFSKVIQNIGSFLAPVGQAFITIGAVAAPMLAQLTTGLGGVGERFNAFIQSAAADGSLTAWIQRGIDALSGLFTFLGQIGSIIGSVFSAANAAGLGFGGTIGTLVGVVANFLNSFEGQQALTAFFEAIRMVGEAVGGVLATALTAIAPVIPPLAQAFGTLAGQVAAVLIPAIQLLAPILQGLATFFAANMVWIGPLAIAIGGIALAIQAVTLAVNLWKAAVMAYTIVQWALNAAMTANPIGLVIAAIVALIAIIVLIVSNLDFFRGIWDTVWKWCSDRVTDVVNWFRNAWQSVFSWLQGAVSAVGNWFSSVWQGAQNIVSGIVNWFRNAWSSAVDAVSGFFSGLAGKVQGAFSSVAGAVKSAINGVIGFVNGAIGGINNVTGAVGIPAIPKIPMLAKGGTARSDRSYLVGEQGPELFTPGRTGRVTNAGTTAEAMGGGGAAAPVIHVYIGETELTDIVDVRIEDNTREAARSIRAGAGSFR